MGALISAAWGRIGIVGQIILILSLVSGIVYGLKTIHDRIDQGGYNRAMQEIADKKANDAQTAAVKIKETEAKYDEIKKSLRANKGYNSPASPLVSSAIARMPKRAGSK